jgi:flagellum-specific ATP synthase
MKALAEQFAELEGVGIYGRVVGVRGLMIQVASPIHAMSVGALPSCFDGLSKS